MRAEQLIAAFTGYHVRSLGNRFVQKLRRQHAMIARW